ncbi:MAG TPA: DUF6600 domain-containing protein [Candidatus Cybelea sp.]|nr:DUF6600 domain-containing protein [Candidatus Cybelea sp.]
MINKWLVSLISGVALVGTTLSSALPVLADQAPDKNGPGVTRVSIVEGSVVIQRGDSNKQVTAVVNAPLLPGDYISTGANARGELQFDGSTAVRLGGNVQARITNDDPNNRQLQLADGTVELGIVHADGPVQIDTPSVTVRAHDSGDLRVSIGKDGSSWVTVRRGSAEVVTPQQTYTLDSGRTLVARGSASDPSITYTTEVGYDTFDDFNAKRDQTMVAALNASPNLNPEIAGYDNLSAYGQWQDVPGYGQSWVPDQTANWSPYGNGSWTWESGYGWTWVANEPWGWAPYHYGRWYYANGYGWAWNPPAYSSYPAWSPALVGFFGFGVGGAGWNVSVGFGGGYGGFGYPYLGWYPLAPYAPYYPWYPGWAWTGYGWGWGGYGCCGWGHNVVRVTNVTNIYRYFPHGGVHGVTVGNFQHGTIHGNTFTVNQHNIGGRVGEIHGGVPITPTRDNLGFGGHSVSAPVTLSRSFDSGRFASANRNLAGHMQFDAQQRAVAHEIQGNGGHTNAPVSREGDRSGAVTAGNREGGSLAGNRGDASFSSNHENGSLSGNRENAPSNSWTRFNETRGSEMRGNDARGNETRGTIASQTGRSESGSNGRESFASEGSHSSRAPSDSWGRFSNERGSVSAPTSRGESYGRDSYNRDSYGHDSYGGSSRSSYPSYSRSSSYPSYSRSSSYPSYSRSSSYPSYSRGSNPAYARSSYPSYSRSSAPSYSRGSSPSYSHGGTYSAPHPSGGGGGGDRHGGGGRPPTQ